MEFGISNLKLTKHDWVAKKASCSTLVYIVAEAKNIACSLRFHPDARAQCHLLSGLRDFFVEAAQDLRQGIEFSWSCQFCPTTCRAQAIPRTV
jgi:hypothetical protein